MREHLNYEARQRYDSYVLAAIRGGCDQKQAESIARQRYLEEVNRHSEALATFRRRHERLHEITATVRR